MSRVPGRVQSSAQYRQQLHVERRRALLISHRTKLVFTEGLRWGRGVHGTVPYIAGGEEREGDSGGDGEASAGAGAPRGAAQEDAGRARVRHLPRQSPAGHVRRPQGALASCECICTCTCLKLVPASTCSRLAQWPVMSKLCPALDPFASRQSSRTASVSSSALESFRSPPGNGRVPSCASLGCTHCGHLQYWLPRATNWKQSSSR